MSKATKQSLALLAVVTGCISTLRRNNHFSRVDMKELLNETYTTCEDVLQEWPCTGDEGKNYDWINTRVQDQWHPFIHSDKDVYGTAVIAKICERVLADLKTVIKDQVKLELLSRLEVPFKKIHDFVDPDGRNFPAYEKADFAMDELYRLIEWRW